MAAELDRFVNALGRLVERERDVAADVAALASAIASATKEVAEDVAERRENVLDVVEMVAPIAVYTGVAETVVTRALVGVAEHFKGFGGFLESLDRLFVARVFVRMVLHGQSAIRGRDL